ncbi:MAG: molybdopterin oxidoreductase family protein [Elusimicrobia bacterium]|nr:molybdopterin oxidoreductase family protein [Elusimicrobiota bacterium]MBP9698462.1 molybdopterin oxidoreductase family protein [Elusimicrobiota bacterium]
MQCGFKLWVEPRNNQVIGLEGDEEFPTTHGLMCVKGSHSTQQIHHADRLVRPRIRETNTDPWTTVSWDAALDFCAKKIRAVQDRHGRSAMAVFGGGALTNETVYLLGKWARLAVKTPHVDYNGRYCMSSAAAAQNRAFGVDRGLPFPVSDISKAKFILLIGANIAECLPPLVDVFKEARAAGALVYTVDPRRTETARVADKNLAVRPGTDLALGMALLQTVIAENRVDEKFVRAHTTGFEAARLAVQAATPEWAETITGVDADLIRETARRFASAPTAMLLSSRGPEQQSKGTETVLSFINFVLATGKIGCPGSGFGTLTGQGNGQGGREHGQKADQLPGYRKIDHPAHRREVAAVWGVDESEIPGPGLSASEILRAVADKKIRGLFVMGSNPVVSAPDVGRVRAGIEKLDFLAVTDFFPSETTELAHVVFPTTVWAESPGTMTNLEGRVILREKAVDPPAGLRPDWEILCDLAERMGVSGFSFRSAENVFDELRRVSQGGIADYSGISYDKIRQEKGVHWPCPSETHPGTPRLFLDGRFWREDGKALFHAVHYRPAAEEPDAEYPYRLTTGRVLEHYLTGNQTHRIPPLESRRPAPWVEIHPSLAGKIGVVTDGKIRLTSRRGTVVVSVDVTDTIRPDTIFAPIHWGGDACINLLTNPVLDPLSKMPEFKVCAVKIEAVP